MKKLIALFIIVILLFILGVVYTQEQDNDWTSDADDGTVLVQDFQELQYIQENEDNQDVEDAQETEDNQNTEDDVTSEDDENFVLQASTPKNEITKTPNATLTQHLFSGTLSKAARIAVTEFSFFVVAIIITLIVITAYAVTMCIPEPIPEHELKAAANKPKRKLNIDEVTEYLGNGRLQHFLLLFAGLSAILHAAEVMIMSFLMPQLEAQWNLSPFQSASIGATVFVGELIGNMVWGYMSDKLGRKITTIVSTLVCTVFGIASAFSQGYWVFLILRFFVGMGVTADIIPYALFAEFLPVNSRAMSLMNIQSFWSIGSIGVNVVAIVFLPRTAQRLEIFGNDGWRYLLVVCALPFIVMGIAGFFLPESARYYLVSKQYDKVQEVFEKAAFYNEKVVDFEIVYPEHDSFSDEQRGRIRDLFTRKNIFLTLVLAVIWIFSNFAYFGVGLFTPIYYANKGSGIYDVYITTMITSLAEIPGQVFGYLTLNWVGRKLTMAFAQLTAFVSFAILFANHPLGLMVACTFIARGASSCTTSVLYVYTAEVYPTTIRGTAFGFQSALSRIFLVTTPYLTNALSTRDKVYPAIIVFVLMSLLGSIASFILPIETTGKHLEDFHKHDDHYVELHQEQALDTSQMEVVLPEVKS